MSWPHSVQSERADSPMAARIEFCKLSKTTVQGAPPAGIEEGDYQIPSPDRTESLLLTPGFTYIHSLIASAERRFHPRFPIHITPREVLCQAETCLRPEVGAHSRTAIPRVYWNQPPLLGWKVCHFQFAETRVPPRYPRLGLCVTPDPSRRINQADTGLCRAGFRMGETGGKKEKQDYTNCCLH